MSIQWFPGHMHAARQKAAETMAKVDVVIEVLDARHPQASSNPLLETLRTYRQRPCLKVLNKSDLADPMTTNEWCAWYKTQQTSSVIAINSHARADTRKILRLANTLAPHRGTPLKPLRMMIMGIPNVGKSTLINALLKKRVAAVGDEPAVTKTQQRLALGNDQILIDTPGMLWPKFAYPSDGYMLAASHAVGANAMMEEEVALFLVDILQAQYPERLMARYQLSTGGFNTFDLVSTLKHIALRRGLIMQGGQANIEKAAHVLLQDYRSGALGRISLETPISRKAMLASAV